MRQILSQLETAVGMGLAAIIAALFIAIQRKVLAKLHVQMSAEQEERERKIVKDAVFHAEEWGAKQASQAVTGSDKYEKARAAVLARAPWMKDAAIESLIEASVAQLGLGAAAESIAAAAAREAAKIAPPPPPPPLPKASSQNPTLPFPPSSEK